MNISYTKEKEVLFTVQSQTYRTQHQNMNEAHAKLQEYVDQACVVPKKRKFKAPEETEEHKMQRVDRKRK